MAFFTKMSLGKNSFFDDNENTSDDEPGFLSSQNAPSSQKPAKDPNGYSELPVDVYNTTEQIIVVAQVAGVADEDVTISVKDDVLIITVEARAPMDEDLKPNFLHTSELFWGKSSRPVILPQTADVKKIKAKITDKILVVKIPKITEEPTGNVIRIELD